MKLDYIKVRRVEEWAKKALANWAQAETVRLELESKIVAAEKEKKERLRKIEDDQYKLREAEKEKEFLRQLNETLIQNQKDWQTKVNALEQENQRLRREKDMEINNLREQVWNFIEDTCVHCVPSLSFLHSFINSFSARWMNDNWRSYLFPYRQEISWFTSMLRK